MGELGRLFTVSAAAAQDKELSRFIGRVGTIMDKIAGDPTVFIVMFQQRYG